jgi:RNA polymerase sigma-B factor
MGVVRDIPRRRGDDEGLALNRQAGELRLARYRRTQDPGERDALFEHYLPLARSLAGRLRHTSESFDDLLQVASIGLLKAISRYDPARGTAFSSFAVPTILGELRRHMRDRTWTVRVPRGLQELGQRLRPATEELSVALGRPPTAAELAEHVGVTEEEVLDAREAMAAHSPPSLDEPVSSDDEPATRGDLLGREDTRLAAVEDAVLIEQYLADLPPRSREILRLRFVEDLKQHEIGALLGISQMHVSRLIRQSFEQLHARVAEEAPRTPAVG